MLYPTELRPHNTIIIFECSNEPRRQAGFAIFNTLRGILWGNCGVEAFN
jgi:hypothetical protein